MEIDLAHIVISLSGRDKGRLFIVCDTDANFVYLADGRLRRIESPKKKRRKHVRFVSDFETRAGEKLKLGDKVLSSEIRRALSDYVKSMEATQAQGGNMLG